MKGLEDEVDKLRARLDAKDATQHQTQPMQVNGHPIAAPTPYIATPATYQQPLQGYETQAYYPPGSYNVYPPEQAQPLQPVYADDYDYSQGRRHSLPGIWAVAS